MYKQIQKNLDWGVKIASLAVTAPATWIVASELFADVTVPVLYFIMRFAAVFLIEGVLLSNWLLLEFDVKATPEIKARYGITALAMYTALLVIAWKHEGPTGLVFRVALLAALLGSGWDTYVMTWQRATSRVDRSAEYAGKVKRHARKLSVKEAMIRRNMEHQNELALIRAEGDSGLSRMSLLRERWIEGERLDDLAERIRLSEYEESLLAGSNNAATNGAATNGSDHASNGKKKQPSQPAQQSQQPQPSPPRAVEANGQQSSRSKKGISKQESRLRYSILAAFEDDPRYTRQMLSDKLGISTRQVSKIVNELIDKDYLVKEGRDTFLTARGENTVKSAPVR
jgi:hypothetical protein